jgi:hypothetical protein
VNQFSFFQSYLNNSDHVIFDQMRETLDLMKLQILGQDSAMNYLAAQIIDI